jgi:protocatechuate 3,4-dioxygenase beta subunit
MAAAFLSILFGQLHAQPANGVITGRVVSESGAPIPDVTVRATIFEGPHWRKDAITDANGFYEITGLEPENYLVKTVNEQGFVDEYYNDTIYKANANVVKINLSARVENINFSLGRGGYIHGRTRDYSSDEMLANIEIQFINFETSELNGISLTDSLGVYVSPALRPGKYAVKAFGVFRGYIPVYWPNAAEVRNAQPVEVIYDEIKRNQNFRLQKGGVLSGTVYADDANLGIDSVWVVVLDSNEAWVSQAWTKNGGQYTAGGLRTGNYRVWVYEVNPWKYRAEYYQDASNYNQATWVSVTSPQTTSGIDLYLEKVSTARVRNEFIELAVTDKYPGTNLTIGTTGGLETPADDDQSLLNGHPYPIMSYTTIRIDQQNYRFSSKEGNAVTPPTIAADRKSIIRTWKTQQIEVTQTARLVTSAWASQPREDTAQLEYVIVNQDNLPHEIGLRILFDTKLGETDGAPIDIPYYGSSNYEREFLAGNMPPWWTAQHIENQAIVFSAQGTLQDFGATVPDRFAIARYQQIMPHKWDYSINPSEAYTSDSAVAMWWFPRVIAPGESLKIVTYYGLGEDTPDLEAPEIVQYLPAKFATHVNPATPIQFLIEDKKSGVDTTQIEILINNEPVKWRTEGSLRQLTLFCEPVSPLRYNQVVRVQLRNLQDNAPVPNKRPPDADDYTFSTIWDSLPPVTQRHQPARWSREIALHSTLSFMIRDSLTGVDINSIQFRLDEKPLPFEISGTPLEYSISYQPDTAFQFNESHSVAIDATDLAPTPNKMPTDRYTFYTRVDTLAPKVTAIIPENGAQRVSINSDIVIELEDHPAGVDTNSIFMTVAGDTITPVLSGNIQHLILTHTPRQPFAFNELINIELNAGDLTQRKNQVLTFQSSFRTQIRVVHDDQAPYVVAVQPPDNATQIQPRPLIQVTLADDSAGIDQNSIQLSINSQRVEPQISGSSQRYSVTFQPEFPFDFGAVVRVAIEAADLASQPNQMNRFEWQFTIAEDHEPPLITDLYPAPGASSVYLNARVQCNIQDPLSGVNIDSVFLLINHQPKIFSWQGDSGHYQIYYQPEVPWQHEQTILVQVQAQDLALPPNYTQPVEWSFTTSAILDSIPPFTTNHIPARGATQISPKTALMLQLKDLASGVDSSTIELLIDDERVWPKIEGNSHDYQLSYQPAGFEFNQEVSIRLNARDFAGNQMPEDRYKFSIRVDRDPPYLTDLKPGENEINVAPEIQPSFFVRDQISGVNPNSIQVEINDAPVALEISPDPNQGYFVRYAPASAFISGEVVKIKIFAADLANNQMLPKVFSFQVSRVLPDLVVENFYTIPRQDLKMNVPFKLMAEIFVRNSSVIVPFHVTFYQFTTVLKDTVVQFQTQDSLLQVIYPCQFPRGNYPLKVVADSRDELRESQETNNLAELMANVNEGEGNVRPNPFTPNNDGFNDAVTFDFTQLVLTQPELKLFNFEGQLVQRFFGANPAVFAWDGINSNGTPMPPGIYLYILADGSKTVSKGYIVLAR